MGFCKTGTKESSSLVSTEVHPAFIYTLTRQEFFSYYENKKRPIVNAAIAFLLNEEGKIFLAERPENKLLSGVCEPPGGKIEFGETPEEALIRELKEEIGIDVAHQDLELCTTVAYPYDSYQLSMTCYVCRNWKGDPYGAEGQKIAWYGWEELRNLCFFSATVIPFHRVREILENESRKGRPYPL